MSSPNTMDDTQILSWKMKQLVKRLDACKGNGTSMITLAIHPTDHIYKIAQMLTNEYGTATNIKSRVNRLSVLSAITCTQQKLKLHSKVPANGLVLFCGTITTDEGKEKRIAIDLEPFKAINTSMYCCDNKFHTKILSNLMDSDASYGFIIVNGHGAHFATLSGDTTTIINKIEVDLPKKHGRGGQSAARFARLRMDARHNYIRKITELATQSFIADDKVVIAGLILAGSADFKYELSQSSMLDPRLSNKIMKLVDINHGGERGLNEAIGLASDVLSNVKLVGEKLILSTFFEQIALDTGKVSYGIHQTMMALDLSAVDTIICWEHLKAYRFVYKNEETGQQTISYVNLSGLKEKEVERMPLVEWFAEHYKEHKIKLEIVSDRSPEGSQFVHGFGGLSALLRYKVDFEQVEGIEEDEIESEDDEG